MPKLTKFMKMVKIELEDFEEDLFHLIAGNRLRLKRKEITDYVFKGNDVVLREAKEGIKNICNFLGKVDTKDFKDLNQLSEYLKTHTKKIFSDSGTPKMDQIYIYRKIDKVLKYLSE